jgi:hypothetical protein
VVAPIPTNGSIGRMILNTNLGGSKYAEDFDNGEYDDEDNYMDEEEYPQYDDE